MSVNEYVRRFVVLQAGGLEVTRTTVAPGPVLEAVTRQHELLAALADDLDDERLPERTREAFVAFALAMLSINDPEAELREFRQQTSHWTDGTGRT